MSSSMEECAGPDADPLLTVSPSSQLPAACALCDQPIKSLDACARHIINSHLSELMICSKCKRGFVDVQQYRKHTAKHAGVGEKVACAFCPFFFNNCSLLEKHDLEKHAYTRPGAVLKRYAIYLSAELNMNFYNYIKKVEKQTKLLCRLCPFNTDQVDHYLWHAKRCRQKKYVCDDCSQVFRNKQFLLQHLKKYCYCADNAKQSKRRTQCKNCKNKINPDVYEEHKKMCVAYKCVRCDETFSTMTDCNEHFTANHGNESLKLKTCPYCRMEFIAQAMLDKHVKLHEKYRCLECGKQFRTPKPLLQHLKTHKDIMPYKCVPCGRNFRDGFDFKIHITQHNSQGYINFDENNFVVYSLEPPKKPQEAAAGASEEALAEHSEQKTKSGIDIVLEREASIDEAHSETEKGTEDASEVQQNVTRRKRKAIKVELDSDSEPLAVKKKKLRSKRNYMKRKKTKNSVFTCAICRKRVYDLATYNRHINLHFRAGYKQCVHCAKILPNRATLDAHIRDEHSSAKDPPNPLHRYLKARAQTKLQARLAQQREDQKKALREKIRAKMKRPPFKMILQRVAAPTFDLINNCRIRSIGAGVTIKQLEGTAPPPKIGDLTVQRYVENFQPEEPQVKTLPEKDAHKKIQLLSTNKSLKVRSVRSTIANQMYKIKTRPFKPERRARVKGIKAPTKVVYDPEYHEVIVKRVVNYESEPRLDYGTLVEEPRDQDYFEAEDDEEVVHVEVSSTPQPATPKRARGYVVELTGDVTNSQLESKLAEVCQRLSRPVLKEDLHIGQLTTSAPYFRILNVKQVLRNEKKKEIQMKMEKRFQEIKIGNAQMVQVNPLAHLMKDSELGLKGAQPTLALEVTPLQE